ncbi:MAG: Phosphopantetheine attachment site [Humibacillus sp.]|nr:Phosphopantetheine attachment site [Humibacillus sp.]
MTLSPASTIPSAIPSATPTSTSTLTSDRLDRDVVLAELSRLVSECTDTSPIAPDDNVFDLGVESLMLVGIKEAISDRFAVTVKFSDFFTAYTVEALADLVVARAAATEVVR